MKIMYDRLPPEVCCAGMPDDVTRINLSAPAEETSAVVRNMMSDFENPDRFVVEINRTA